MHSLELARLAATVASMGVPMIVHKSAANQPAAHDFWLANRYRFDLWSQRLREHRAAIDRPGTSHRIRMWFEVMHVFEEILISEPLSRCLACLGSVLESTGHDRDFGPLAHSVLVSHIEMRHRCLNLIVFGHGLPVDHAVKLNRIRRLVENYSDQLLACLPTPNEPETYAFDWPNVQHTQSTLSTSQFAIDQVSFHIQALATSLQRVLQAEIDSRTANARLNAKVSNAALGIFTANHFDSFGFCKSGSSAYGTHTSPESDGNTGDLSLPLQPPLNILLKPHSYVRAKEGDSKHGRI